MFTPYLSDNTLLDDRVQPLFHRTSPDFMAFCECVDVRGAL